MIRGMFSGSAKLIPRSAPAVLLVLLVGAVVAFAGVSHLVSRFNTNQRVRGYKLYGRGLSELQAGKQEDAIEAFRAALTCDPNNGAFQLSLARALRDTGDPQRLDEAQSYLESLWQRTPQDGPVNLALGRLAARRGSVEDAVRYYHNAMYGVWSSDAADNRRKARLELIDFLLQKGARPQAQSEIIALTASLPPNPALHLQAAQFFMDIQDFMDAFLEYEQVLHLDHNSAAAMSGAGNAAYRMGHYRTAERFLQEAVRSDPQNTNARQLLETASMVLKADPFVRRISDAERNRRIVAAFQQAGQRLQSCQQSQAINSNATVLPLSKLADSWNAMKMQLPKLRSAEEADLPDAIMDLVFQIEQQTASWCGAPQGIDQALLIISRDREAADQ